MNHIVNENFILVLLILLIFLLVLKIISLHIVMDNCSISLYIGLLICSGIICFIKNFKFLDTVIIQKPRLTRWSITHVITFYIMGKLCPNQYVRYLLLGILWELFEKIYGHLSGAELYWTSNGGKGQFYDIVMNTIGYHLAHIL
jgi:hypothetical protein